MSDADNTERCARCGAEFTAASSPLGLCPSCLLKLGMSDPAMTPPAAQEPDPVAVAAVAAAVAAVAAPPVSPARSRLRLPSPGQWIGAAAVLVIGATLVFFLFPNRFQSPNRETTTSHADPVRFTLSLPDGTELPDEAQFAVSADGTQIVVAARREGVTRLWLRRLQSLEWRELPQTDRASFPFWSPDSRHIGFFAGRSVKRIDIGNDLTETICDVDEGHGGTWSSQGVIVFAGSSGLFQVPASGGTPSQVTQVSATQGALAHLRPQFLPDGRHFIFLSRTVNNRAGATYVGDLGTGEREAIQGGRGPAAFAAGRLLSSGAALVAQPFDPRRGQPIGDAQTIAGVDGIATNGLRGSTFAASSAVLVYQRHEQRRRRLVWFDREGRMIGQQSEIIDADGFAVSPDGRSVAMARRDEDSDTSSIWVMDVESPRISRITWGRTRDESPVWSPDGAHLALSSHRDDNQGVQIVVRDLNGMERSLLQTPAAQLTDWSRDGRFLIYSARSPKTGSDLWMLPTTGDKKPHALEQTPANESQGVVSPDTRLLAYVSDESGADEIYLRPFPPSEGRWQISTGGGTRPRWRLDGRALLFLSPDGQIMEVDVMPSIPPRSGPPRPLIAVPGADDFAVSPQQRMLVQMPVEHVGGRQLDVILNWTAELRR